MHPPKLVSTVTLLFALSVSGGLEASIQRNVGDSFIQLEGLFGLREFPSWEVVVPLPSIDDLAENGGQGVGARRLGNDIIPLSCQIEVLKRGKPVNKAKGTFESTLFVLDNNTGTFEAFDLGSKKFRTNSDGIDSVDFEIPASIFADGFESGDVSAWSHTRATSNKKKKADQGELLCAASVSK